MAANDARQPALGQPAKRTRARKPLKRLRQQQVVKRETACQVLAKNSQKELPVGLPQYKDLLSPLLIPMSETCVVLQLSGIGPQPARSPIRVLLSPSSAIKQIPT
jgi:hypothetical protein